MKPNKISHRQWYLYNLYLIIEHFIGVNVFEKNLGPRSKKLINDIKNNRGIFERCALEQSETIAYSKDINDLIKDATFRNKPTLIKGGAKSWACMSKWNDDFFCENMGNYPVQIVDNIGTDESKKKSI